MMQLHTYSRVPSFGSQQVPQLAKKFHTFYRSKKFMAMFTRPHHQPLCQARLIQSMPLHPTSLRSISILSVHLSLGLPSSQYLPNFQITILLVSSPRFVPHALLISFSLTFSCKQHFLGPHPPIPSYFPPIIPTYLPRHPTVKHSQFITFKYFMTTHSYRHGGSHTTYTAHERFLPCKFITNNFICILYFNMYGE